MKSQKTYLNKEEKNTNGKDGEMKTLFPWNQKVMRVGRNAKTE